MEFYLEKTSFHVGRGVLLSLKEDLVGASLSNQVVKWRWKWDDSRVFTVNSAYNRLEGLVFSEVFWNG